MLVAEVIRQTLTVYVGQQIRVMLVHQVCHQTTTPVLKYSGNSVPGGRSISPTKWHYRRFTIWSFTSQSQNKLKSVPESIAHVAINFIFQCQRSTSRTKWGTLSCRNAS